MHYDLTGPNVPKAMAIAAAEAAAPVLLGQRASAIIASGVWNGPPDAAGVVLGQAYTVIYELAFDGKRIWGKGHAVDIPTALSNAKNEFYFNLFSLYPATHHVPG